MTDETKGGGLHIDSDWKTEAQQEKERLAAQEQRERQERAASGAPAGREAVGFVEMVNLLAMQAAVALGGMQGPGGERIPPNPAAAQHYIDLLQVLEKKTEGNLTDDEKRVLGTVLHELRMHYVQGVTSPPPPDSRTETG